MNTSSPFSFLESIATRFQPPAWVVDEAQQRLILFLNHVVMQEKEAQDRLARKKGSVLHVRWSLFAMDLLITPAGLLDRAGSAAKPDLLISVAADSPVVVLQSVLAGQPPPVKIEGDVQLAADINWLVDDDDPISYAETWAGEFGLSLFIITLGSEGAVAVKPDGRVIRVPGHQVDLVDTVGAGDTFMAGFLSAYAVDPMDVEAALMRGTAAAALVCSRKGANPPTTAELEEFLAR